VSQQEILERAAAHVRELLAGDSSGHDWFHIERVWKMARRIGQEERADLFVVELAALLHDIADWKFHGGDDSAGPRAARTWLEGERVEPAIVEHVAEIIAGLSFKGAGVETRMRTLEGQCVQDADRLDAIGAMGIARAFAYGGAKGRELYNPAVPPEMHASFEAYKKNKGPTLNHFYEKLFLLAERMNTPTAQKLARGRHEHMQAFVSQFLAEWDGRA
jgi:uncharacterized protein